MDDKLLAKTTKITPLENLYVYGIGLDRFLSLNSVLLTGVLSNIYDISLHLGYTSVVCGTHCHLGVHKNTWLEFDVLPELYHNSETFHAMIDCTSITTRSSSLVRITH